LIKEELARVLLHEIADPRLNGLVINDVDVNADLKHAKVYFTPTVETVKPRELEQGIKRAMPFLRRRIGDNLELRYVPELEFCRDEHGDQVARLYSILDSVNVNKANGEESNPA